MSVMSLYLHVLCVYTTTTNTIHLYLKEGKKGKKRQRLKYLGVHFEHTVCVCSILVRKKEVGL